MNFDPFPGLEIPPLINAAGTLTSLGGCRTRPEVLDAMAQAAGEFVPLEILHQKAGEHLARLLPLPCAACAAGLTLGSRSRAILGRVLENDE